jgi:hypothetical protein
MCYGSGVSQTRILQGRPISDQEVEQIRRLIAEHPQAHRRRLSQLLCAAWDWKNERGQSKDMAARSLMLKLQALGWITLPPVRRPATNAQRGQRLPSVPAPGPRWEGSLASLRPLKLELILPEAKHRDLFHGLLAHYHYLGYRGPTGENLQYLAWSATGQALACLVFDAAAWKVAARDRWLQWEANDRSALLRRITNNSRFLIVPWIRVAHLSSHLLALATQRVVEDWPKKYGHGIDLIETFVQQDRFTGASYRAANWIYLGETQGRSRNDPDRTVQVPVKDLYVYPLSRFYRQRLGGKSA